MPATDAFRLGRTTRAVWFLATALLLLGIVVVDALLLDRHLGLIGFPYQVEYREGATLANAVLVGGGGGLYDLANKPLYTNVYGGLYYLLVTPLVHVLGADLQVLRGVSAGLIAALCVLVFAVLRRRGVAGTAAFAAASALYPATLVYATPVARPDTLGMLLYVLAIVVPWWRGFSTGSLLAGLLLGFLAFLAKPYFALAIPVLLAYEFLFGNRRRALGLGLLTLAATVVFFAVAALAFGTYYHETIDTHIGVRTYLLPLLLVQIEEFARLHWGLLALLLLAAVGGLATRGGHREHVKPAPAGPLGDGPGVKWRMDPFVFALLAAVAACIYPLGGHNGTFLTYFCQLISPFLVLVAFSWLGRPALKSGRFAPLPHVAALALTLAGLDASLSNPFVVADVAGREHNWERVERYLAPFERVLNSPAIVSILLEQGKPLFNNGMSEYFAAGLDAGGDPAIRQANDAWTGALEDGLRARAFDLVVTTQGLSVYPSLQPLQANYRLDATIAVSMHAQRWILEFWRPRD